MIDKELQFTGRFAKLKTVLLTATNSAVIIRESEAEVLLTTLG